MPSWPRLPTILHKTENLFSRVLGRPISFESLSLSPPPARIGVIGTDKWAASELIVRALLEQPFLSDHSMNDAIKSRWQGQSKKITIAHGNQVRWQDSTLKIPSSFLSQFPFPVEIEEYEPGLHPEINKLDIPIISCNPISCSLPQPPSENPNSLLVLIGTHGPPGYIYVDPIRALNGLDAVHKDIQRYQDDYVASRLPAISSHIQQIFSSSSSLELLRTRRVTNQVTSVLNTIQRNLDSAQRQVDDALSAISSVHEQFQQSYNRVPTEILGLYDPSVSSQESHVSNALAASACQMRAHMSRLTWWRMISHVDEINLLVNRIVDEAWCNELEHRLIFHTGRLSSLQSHFTESTSRALDSFITPPFSSPVLRNALHQISSSPSYALSPSTLIHPLHTRKSQIASYPTTRLHVAAQHVVIGMGASIATGAGIGWAGWIGWLTAFDPTTALALGMLTAVAGIRWGIGKWERAKKNWWGDWQRIGEGLERDLEVSLNDALKNQVGVLPQKAYEGFSKLATKRQEEIVELREELESLRKDFEKLE